MDARKRQHLEAKLSAYLDGELSPQEREQVEAFLAADADARRLLADLRAISQSIHGLPRARASDQLLEGMRARLERRALLGEAAPAERPRQPARHWFLGWLAAAACLMLAGGTGYLLWTTQRQTEPKKFAFADKEVTAPEQMSKELAPAPTALAERAKPSVAPTAGSRLAEPARRPLGLPLEPQSGFGRAMGKAGEQSTRGEEEVKKPVAETVAPMPAQPPPAAEKQKDTAAAVGEVAGDMALVDQTAQAAAQPSAPAGTPVSPVTVTVDGAPPEGADQATAVVTLRYSDPASQTRDLQVLQDKLAFRPMAQLATKVQPAEIPLGGQRANGDLRQAEREANQENKPAPRLSYAAEEQLAKDARAAIPELHLGVADPQRLTQAIADVRSAVHTDQIEVVRGVQERAGLAGGGFQQPGAAAPGSAAPGSRERHAAGRLAKRESPSQAPIGGPTLGGGSASSPAKAVRQQQQEMFSFRELHDVGGASQPADVFRDRALARRGIGANRETGFKGAPRAGLPPESSPVEALDSLAGLQSRPNATQPALLTNVTRLYLTIQPSSAPGRTMSGPRPCAGSPKTK